MHKGASHRATPIRICRCWFVFCCKCTEGDCAGRSAPSDVVVLQWEIYVSCDRSTFAHEQNIGLPSYLTPMTGLVLNLALKIHYLSCLY